jgi:hypothetical protein
VSTRPVPEIFQDLVIDFVLLILQKLPGQMSRTQSEVSSSQWNLFVLFIIFPGATTYACNPLSYIPGKYQKHPREHRQKPRQSLK